MKRRDVHWLGQPTIAGKAVPVFGAEGKGDSPGHPFRGNQFASGESMGADQLRDHIGQEHGASLSVQQPGVRSLAHLRDLHDQMHENPGVPGGRTTHTHETASDGVHEHLDLVNSRANMQHSHSGEAGHVHPGYGGARSPR